MRSFRPTFAVALACLMFAAQPATADDGRRHVMTATQKIDMVRDLPDTPTFEREGLHYDLGYIYPVRTVNGASVASAGGDAGFVLYNGDRYARLTASDVAELQYVLGEDPTQGYTPPTRSASRTAASDPWGANAAADDARGQPLAAAPAGTTSSRRGGGIIATLFLMFVVLFLRVRLFRDLVIGGVLAAIAGIARRSDTNDDEPRPMSSSDTFNAQASAQRARLDALSGGAASTPTAVGGFGRKLV